MDPRAPEFVYTGATFGILRQKQEQDEEEPQGIDDVKTKAVCCEPKEKEEEVHLQEYEDTSTIKAASCESREDVEPEDFDDTDDNDASLSDCGDLTCVPQCIFVPAGLEKISAQEARRRRYRGSGHDQYGRWHESNVPPKVVILPDRVFYSERRTTEDEKAYVVEGQPWVPGLRRKWAGNLVTPGPELVGALDVRVMTTASADARDFTWMPNAPVFEPRSTTRQNSEEDATALPSNSLLVPRLPDVAIDDPALVASSLEVQEASPPCGVFLRNTASPSIPLRLWEEQPPQPEKSTPLSPETELSFPDLDFSTVPDFSTLEKAFVDKVMRWTEIEDKGKAMGKEILALKKRTQAQEANLYRLRNNHEALLDKQEVSKAENEKTVEGLKAEIEKISKELKSYEAHETLKVEHEKMFEERKVYAELEALKLELKHVSGELSKRKEMEAARFQRLADFQKSLQHRTFLSDVERRTLFMIAQQIQKGWGLERLVNQHRMDQYYSAKVQEDGLIIAELGCKVVELNSEVMRLNAQVERLLDDSLEDMNSLFEEEPSSKLAPTSSRTESPVSGQAPCPSRCASPIPNPKQEIQHLCSWCSKKIAKPFDWTRKEG
jgi:hypothetical protein